MNLERAKTTFIEESRELLQQMEAILLQAEETGLQDGADHALFRCAHTIKGSAGMFGLDTIVAFTHVVENVLDRIRNASLDLGADLTALLLEAKDHLAALVEVCAGGDAGPAAQGDALLRRLRAYAHPGGAAIAVSSMSAPAVAATAQADPLTACTAGPLGQDDLWHLSLRFGKDVLKHGLDPLAFVRYLTQYGAIVHIEAITDAMPRWETYQAEDCYLGYEIALRSQASKADIENVFEFIREDATIRILPPHSRIDEYLGLIESLPEDKQRLGDILVACGTLTRHELDAALGAQHQARSREPGAATPIGAMLVQAGIVHPPVVEAALDKQKRAEEKRAKESRSIKVEAERLDQLIDLVGELVIAGASTQLLARQFKRPELVESAASLLRLVEDVRDTALRLRMVQIGEVFGRFPRVVRDVARELGKDIALKVCGAEAELDKSMVEKLGDPLMHLVRNAIDHGIEAPALRLARGKPARGSLSLNAYHESGSIVIEVADDGGGLDAEKILAKALERGLVGPGQNLSRDEVLALVLDPVFSTAEQVTNLSGRGVGMDVVRSHVEALRGTLNIDSEPLRGTTMRICLPLTLAIIDGFQVSVGERGFIVPLDMVVECIERPADVRSDYLDLRGEVLPFVRLRALFDVSAPAPNRRSVVVVRFGGRKVGLEVDRLHGECQTVIKPLGRLFERLSGISGSTILGSGEVALILDVPHLVQQAMRREQPSCQ